MAVVVCSMMLVMVVVMMAIKTTRIFATVIAYHFMNHYLQAPAPL